MRYHINNPAPRSYTRPAKLPNSGAPVQVTVDPEEDPRGEIYGVVVSVKVNGIEIGGDLPEDVIEALHQQVKQ